MMSKLDHNSTKTRRIAKTPGVNPDRRRFLGRGSSLSLAAIAWSAGLITPSMLFAAKLEETFSMQPVDRLLATLADGLQIQATQRIRIKIPEVAENGRVVPVSVTSSLQDVQSIAIVGEKNPVPLIGQFHFTDTTEAFVQARIKLAESGHVIVLANAGNQLYSNRKFVNVTVGGCGS